MPTSRRRGSLGRSRPCELGVLESEGGRQREGTEKSNTEAPRHGGRTEGLWPARLRRAGRIGQAARIQVVLGSIHHLYSRGLSYSCRAQRGATALQSRCLQVFLE